LLDKHTDSKTIAEQEAERLSTGIRDTLDDPACTTLSVSQRKLLDLPPPPRPPRSEVLFEFIRQSDHAPISCEIRFHV